MTPEELYQEWQRFAEMAEATKATGPISDTIKAVLEDVARLELPPAENGRDRPLTVDELAELTGMSRRWVYEHADKPPLRECRLNLPGAIRFSEKRVQQHIMGRQRAVAR